MNNRWGFYMHRIDKHRVPASIVAWVVLAGLGGWITLGITSVVAADRGSARWEPAIREFEKADRASPPPRNGYLFVGSSSIRKWTGLAEDFAGKPVIRRGFGGSEMSDCLAYADRIILPYHPKAVFVYEGDNDLADRKRPQEILAEFKQLVGKIHQALPQTLVGFISIKPSPSRWHLAAKMRQANRLVEDYAAATPGVAFIDVYHAMLGTDGRPKADIFLPDRLHMNRRGYALWREILAPYLRD